MPCLETIQLLEAKVKRLEHEVNAAYFQGFLSGYNQEECLINPQNEATTLANEYAARFTGENA